ncbi:MAG: YHS domain-containing protein, partial [Alphaproteobacteria bacterium]|nr:YHS domain-containing protein [Alphaproteobacteria bacterium]
MPCQGVSVQSGGNMSSHHPQSSNAHGAGNATEKDPVCGMQVEPARARHHITHDGQRYYFCSAHCQEKFSADPAKWLTKGDAPRPAQTTGTIYTCPMHPEIRQEGPGACPICGMALEPVTATTTSEPNHELADMRRRFWFALVLAVPVFILDMAGDIAHLRAIIGQGASDWIQFALATPVVLWSGWPFFARGWKSLVTRHLNMFTLIAIGVGVAWLYS